MSHDAFKFPAIYQPGQVVTYCGQPGAPIATGNGEYGWHGDDGSLIPMRDEDVRQLGLKPPALEVTYDVCRMGTIFRYGKAQAFMPESWLIDHFDARALALELGCPPELLRRAIQPTPPVTLKAAAGTATLRPKAAVTVTADRPARAPGVEPERVQARTKVVSRKGFGGRLNTVKSMVRLSKS